MTGAASICTFCCRAPEDVSEMKLANNCDLSNGEPCSACQDYMAIEAQISATKRLLDDLIMQRSTIRSRVNQNHDLLTSRVPVEVVCSAFQFCVPTEWDLDDFDFHYQWYCDIREKWMVSGPLLLGRICKTWRTIAWGLESLWSVLRLFFGSNSSHRYAVLAREWLNRGGKRLLSIRMSDLYVSRTNWIDQEAELISLINDKSEQWKNLDIIASPWFVSQFQGNSAGAPNLQALRIICPGGEDITTVPVQFSLTGGKPRPWHLTIHASDVDSVHTDWKHLTNVIISQPTPDDATLLLRHASNVVNCRLYEFCEATENFSIPNQPIIHGALESLDIGCSTSYPDQSEEIMFVFQSFIFPNLKHLKIRSGGTLEDIQKDSQSEVSWSSVLAHIRNSSPPLISLTAHYLPFTECTIPILKICPLLRDLEILRPILGDMSSDTDSIFHDYDAEQEIIDFFQLLADTSIPSNLETEFLPNLQSINLVVERTHARDADRIWASIPGVFGPISDIHNPRRRPLKALRAQTFQNLSYFNNEESESVALKISKLREEGILLDLRDGRGHQVFRDIHSDEPVDSECSDSDEYEYE